MPCTAVCCHMFVCNGYIFIYLFWLCVAFVRCWFELPLLVNCLPLERPVPEINRLSNIFATLSAHSIYLPRFVILSFEYPTHYQSTNSINLTLKATPETVEFPSAFSFRPLVEAFLVPSWDVLKAVMSRRWATSCVHIYAL